jgi:UPF0716 protein FxsA
VEFTGFLATLACKPAHLEMPVLFKLLLLFITVPFVELTLLLYLADRTNWMVALAMVVIPGVVGTWLAQSQGWRTWVCIQTELAAGRMPTAALLDAALIFVAGALLLTPGMLSDLVGILLLIPPTRQIVRRRLVAWFKSRFRLQTVPFSQTSSTSVASEVIDSYVVDDSSDHRTMTR